MIKAIIIYTLIASILVSLILWAIIDMIRIIVRSRRNRKW